MRKSLLTLSFAGLLAVISTLAVADGVATDTSRLPRESSRQPIYASPATTIFKSALSVQAAAQATKNILLSDGWQNYDPPFSSKQANAQLALFTFKKGGQAISIMISQAPAQGNATTVQYATLPLQTDLPFPPDGVSIQFSPDRPYLKCYTTGPLDKTLAFFGNALAQQGWEAWSPEDVAKIPAGRPIARLTPNAAIAYFVRSGKTPIKVTLVQQKDARVLSVITKASDQEMDLPRTREQARKESEKEDARKAAARAKAQQDFAKEQSKFDAMTDGIMKQALQGALTGAPPVPSPMATDSSDTLRPMGKSPAPIPLPSTAYNITVDTAAALLEYASKSTVSSLAAFHRRSMKRLGWRERRSVINQSNMVVMSFAKNGKQLELTVMQMGPAANVNGRGSALAAAKMAPTSDNKVAGARIIQDLKAEDKGGLPVPTPNTSSGRSATPFLTEITATVSADIETVLAFYRRELAKKNWTENRKRSKSSARNASIEFASPQGPAVLKVSRIGAETNVSLALRNNEAAKQSGLLPKRGKVKILFGNIMDTDSVITVNRRKITVGAGTGAKAPDGPSMELSPGTYTFSVAVKGKPDAREKVTVGRDSIWGIMIGPGGLLPVQMY